MRENSKIKFFSNMYALESLDGILYCPRIWRIPQELLLNLTRMSPLRKLLCPGIGTISIRTSYGAPWLSSRAVSSSVARQKGTEPKTDVICNSNCNFVVNLTQ
ncbi:hypothetical protein Y032_0004g2024 [Ancylostoma ceylanicum]|uniref:Uncharacterized protein n=1 Tax=Ancylostoma ceylanicum TaxID=53326 RepID=A0A016VVZ3_9BILA|nr:hypothetical protein Y032_0004g2024 [Ancylostoma ceylanicum]